ncbi:MAG: hypothetical protein AAF548_13270 [Actinomycetota bacterium]
MTGITVSRREGRLIAVKSGVGDAAERRRHEGRVLARLDHPGVVELLEVIDDTDRCDILLGYAGTETWQVAPPSTDAAIVEGLAVLSATIGDLHELGTTHGALTPDHVVVGPDRRPVLCGLADATSVDPTSRGRDITGLGELISTTSAAASPEIRVALAEIAAWCHAGEPSARAVTARLNDLRPPTAARRRLPITRRHAVIAAVGISAAAVVVSVIRPSDDPRETVDEQTAPATVVPAEPEPSTPSTTEPPSGPAPSDAAEPVVVEHDGRRYGVGDVGDIVVVGDWNCDGIGTPALLQVASGHVARFDRWPEVGGEIAPTSQALHTGAVGLDVVPAGPCDRLRVIEPSGSRLFEEAS